MSTKKERADYQRKWLNSSEENKVKNRNRATKWKNTHPEKAASTKRKGDLRRRYGMTVQQWDELFISQGACCAICKTKEPSSRGWFTDHCHTTNKVRGILCQQCNALIGFAKDSVTVLANGIDYLTRSY